MEPKKNPKIDVNGPGYTRVFFQAGLTLALLLTVMLFSFKKYEKKKEAIKVIHDIPDIEFVDPTTQDPPKKLPPPPPELEVVDDTEEPPDNTDAFENKDASQDLEIPTFTAPKPKKPIEPEIFTIVEDMPEFPGGFGKMQKYLQETIEYPEDAEYEGITGTVYIRMMVDVDGKVKRVSAMMPADQQLGYGLEEEAIRVVKKMPRWTPGRQASQKVPVWVNIPITFELDEDGF
jgi:protein TonB